MSELTEKKDFLQKASIAEKDFSTILEIRGYPEDFSQAVIGLAWRAVLRRCYFDGEAKEPSDEVDEAVWEAIEKWAQGGRLDDLDDLLTIRRDGDIFPGTPGEAILAARNVVRQADFKSGSLGALLFYRFAPTLKKWEATSLATPEQQADLLLGSLGGKPGRRLRPLPVLAEFGARLWHRLQSQRDRDIDYWKTVRAFGDFLHDAKGPDTLVLAAHAYHVLIDTLRPEADDEEAADLIRGAANNLASLLDDLAGKSPAPSSVKAIAAAALLHLQVSAAIENRAGMSSSARRWRALDDLANTPTAFQQVPGDDLATRRLRQAWFSARAAVVRARLRKPGKNDAKDVATAFFNAGVALLRGGNRRRTEAIKAQLVINALGLWWATWLANGDGKLALGTYNGSDCAVNLFGALDDLDERLRDSLRSGMSALWSALAAEREWKGSDIARSDIARLERAAERLGLEKGSSPDGPSLQKATAVFLAGIGETFKLPQLKNLPSGESAAHESELETKKAAVVSWLVVKSSLRALLPGDVTIAQLCRPVWQVLNREIPRLDELPESIKKITEEWHDNSVVETGSIKKEDFEKLLELGKKEPNSLGEWIENNAMALAEAMAD